MSGSSFASVRAIEFRAAFEALCQSRNVLVRRPRRIITDRRTAAHKHDTAVALTQRRQRRTDRGDERHRVDVERIQQGFGRLRQRGTYQVFDPRKLGNAGIQDQRVQTLPALQCLVDGTLVVTQLRDVALHHSEGVGEVLLELLELLRLGARERHDICSRCLVGTFQEQLEHSKAKAAACAGEENHLLVRHGGNGSRSLAKTGTVRGPVRKIVARHGPASKNGTRPACVGPAMRGPREVVTRDKRSSVESIYRSVDIEMC